MNRRRWFAVFLLIFIVSLSGLVVCSLSIWKKGASYNRIAAQHVSVGTKPEVPSASAKKVEETNLPDRQPVQRETVDWAEHEPQMKGAEQVIDFEGLQAINQDIYAWISIPGTGIEYPIVQSSDDDAFYLHHTVERTRGLPGSIYTEGLNQKDFSDMNTVIYGHNMKNGSMFAGLHQYKNPGFMDDNQLIYIYTPEKRYIYQIFAGVTYNDCHLLKTFDFQQMVSYQEFMDSLYQARTMESYVDEGVEMTLKTSLITLSTCTKSDFQRFLVVAKLINED